VWHKPEHILEARAFFAFPEMKESKTTGRLCSSLTIRISMVEVSIACVRNRCGLLSIHHASGGMFEERRDKCDNILSGCLCAVTTVFSQQDGIYGFKFPNRFLEISSSEISLFSQSKSKDLINNPLVSFTFAFARLNAFCKQQSDILTVYQTQFFA
jgi:hypothetical protein